MLDKLLSPVVELPRLRHQVLRLVVRIGSGQLLAQREDFLVQVDQQTFDGNAEAAFRARFDLLALDDVLLERSQNVDLVGKLRLNRIEQAQCVFVAGVLIELELPLGAGAAAVGDKCLLRVALLSLDVLKGWLRMIRPVP